MVRLIHKTKIASAVTLAVAAPALILAGTSAPAQAECTNCTQNVDFNVNVAEVITVSITDPASWASGDLTYNETTSKYESALLRNKVTVSAATNNATGVTVSMYTKNTNLVNQTNNEYVIPTLGGETLASAISANQWGYSTATIGETDEGNNDAKYNKLTTSESPITVFTTVGTDSTSNGHEDIYFGAKADEDKQSGTYAQTVYFAAVTGTVNTDNPQIPEQPSTPTTPSTPVYASTQGVGTAGQTTYTYPSTTSQDGTTKTNTTEVSSGDTTSSYAKAAGVTTSSSSINGGVTVATALAVAAAVAAVSGSVFFIVAKRRNDDDEEEE